MSAYPGSSTHNNFYAMSMVPCSTELSAEAAGMCGTNVDGACIRGGSKVAGGSGYSLSSLGFPTDQCNAFPLFASSNHAYSQMGWEATTNLNPLRINRPIL